MANSLYLKIPERVLGGLVLNDYLKNCRWRRFLDNGAQQKIHADPFEAAEGAVQINSVLRSKVITIKKT